MKTAKRWFWITLIAACVGCSRQVPLSELDQTAAFERLRSDFQRGDYQRANEGLNYYTLNFSGSAKIDSAQFLLAWSHYYLKEYLLAASAFDELVKRFPRSSLVPESMFMVGVCYWKMSPRYALDQEYTNKAIDAFQAFIDYYPGMIERVREAEEYIGRCREKLAHKAYATGVIYLKMKDWRAAEIYFRKVTDEYYDTPWAAPAAFQVGHSLQKQGKEADAAQAFRTYVEKFPGHQWRQRALEALKVLPGKEG